MNEEYLKSLMSIIMPKSKTLMNILKHDLITLGHVIALNEVQEAAIESAIQGALISGMQTTIQKLIVDEKIK